VKCLKEPWNFTDSLSKQLKLRKMSKIFGAWNVRSLHWASLVMTVVKEWSEYELDLVEL
jgi:hypothetical protein